MPEILADALIKFIQASPSVYHVVDNFRQELRAQAYQELFEHQAWELLPAQKYFVCRNDSSIIAFTTPAKLDDLYFKIVASHSDCPTLKLKPQYLLAKEAFSALNVEPYGGLLMHTWFDRPLTIAGRVFIKEAEEVVSRLFVYPGNLAMIPSLAIHLNRQANEASTLNAQQHLLPLLNKVEAGFIEQMIAEQLAVKIEEIVEWELFLRPTELGYKWGLNNEFLAAVQLDDLACAYTSFQAFLKTPPTKAINVFACFDNEEVGSLTQQGAASSFLKATLSRINQSTKQDFYQSLAKSFLISADNAHSHHPNYPEKSDPSNQVMINQGVVIKYNANQSYITDGLSAALFKEYCHLAEVPYQVYTNRSDLRGGKTLGSINLSQVSLASIDIGLAQWAMHSINESAGCLDLKYLKQVLSLFYQKELALSSTSFKIEQ